MQAVLKWLCKKNEGHAQRVKAMLNKQKKPTPQLQSKVTALAVCRIRLLYCYKDSISEFILWLVLLIL